MTIGEKNIALKDIMRVAVSVHEDETLDSILRKMIGEKRNSVVVVNGDGVLVGFVGAIDVIKAVLPDYLEEDIVAAHFADQSILKEDALRATGTSVKEFMTEVPATIKESASVLEAAATAIQSGQGRITVVDDAHKPVGIITRTEIKQVIGSLLDIPGSFE